MPSERYQGQSFSLGPEHQELLAGYRRYLFVECDSSPHTLRSYVHDVEDYLRWCEKGSVDALHPGHRDIRGYMGVLNRAGYARSTVNRHLSSVKSFYRWLVQTGRCSQDPSSVMQGPKKPKTLPKRISAHEMAAILSVHRNRLASLDQGQDDQRLAMAKELRDQAMLEFLYACGARVSEASGLFASQVDFPLGQVKVFGKGRKERIIPLHQLCLESMERYLRQGRAVLADRAHGSSAPNFFLSNRGGAYSTDAIRRMFAATLKEAGVYAHYTPHDMRHTFASDVLEGGADLRSVQEMLGHASLSTTQIYTHVSASRLIDVHHQAHPRG